jgi:hypothetical protein
VCRSRAYQRCLDCVDVMDQLQCIDRQWLADKRTNLHGTRMLRQRLFRGQLRNTQLQDVPEGTIQQQLQRLCFVPRWQVHQRSWPATLLHMHQSSLQHRHWQHRMRDVSDLEWLPLGLVVELCTQRVYLYFRHGRLAVHHTQCPHMQGL